MEIHQSPISNLYFASLGPLVVCLDCFRKKKKCFTVGKNVVWIRFPYWLWMRASHVSVGISLISDCLVFLLFYIYY